MLRMKRMGRPWMRLVARLIGTGSRRPPERVRVEEPRETGAWAGSVDRIRAFTGAVHDAEGWSPLCRRIAALLGASGAAVVRWDPLADAGLPLGVFGSWEGEDLGRLLAEGRCEWAFALQDSPAFAVQSNGRIRAARGASDPIVVASALALPLRVGADRIGALLCAYPSQRPITPEDVAGAELVSLCATLLCNQQDLAATSDRQAKRIARLMDDIERMAINLRGGAARDGIVTN